MEGGAERDLAAVNLAKNFATAIDRHKLRPPETNGLSGQEPGIRSTFPVPAAL